MPNISHKAEALPASAIRKLVPFADAAEAKGIHVFHLNIGAPDIKSPDCALEAVHNLSLHHVSYTHSAGRASLRRKLVEDYYKKVGIDISQEELIVTIGGSEAIEIALSVCCDDGDDILIMEPYYTNYNTFCRKLNLHLRTVHTNIRDGFRMPDLSEFEKALTPKTRAVFINNPVNPTGTIYSKEMILEIGKFCLEHDLFLISDEVYREFCYTDEPYFSAMNIPGLEQNVILVDSVSKRYNLCGARTGMIVSRNKDVMKAAMKYAQARLSPPLIGQIASEGAIDAPQEYFDEVREEYIRRRDYTLERLNAMEGVYSPVPMGAFYTLAELPIDDSESFAKWLLTSFSINSQTTMVTPAKSFYSNQEDGMRQVRIAYVLEVPELKKALDILEEALKNYPGRTLRP